MLSNSQVLFVYIYYFSESGPYPRQNMLWRGFVPKPFRSCSEAFSNVNQKASERVRKGFGIKAIYIGDILVYIFYFFLRGTDIA